MLSYETLIGSVNSFPTQIYPFILMKPRPCIFPLKYTRQVNGNDQFPPMPSSRKLGDASLEGTFLYENPTELPSNTTSLKQKIWLFSDKKRSFSVHKGSDISIRPTVIRRPYFRSLGVYKELNGKEREETSHLRNKATEKGQILHKRKTSAIGIQNARLKKKKLRKGTIKITKKIRLDENRKETEKAQVFASPLKYLITDTHAHMRGSSMRKQYNFILEKKKIIQSRLRALVIGWKTRRVLSHPQLRNKITLIKDMGKLIYDIDKSDPTAQELRKNITEQLVLYKTKFLILYRNLFWSAEWAAQQQLPPVCLSAQRVGNFKELKLDSLANRALLRPLKGDCEATAEASPEDSLFPTRGLPRKKELNISLDLSVPVKKLYLNRGFRGSHPIKLTWEHSNKADSWVREPLQQNGPRPQKLPHQKVDFSRLSHLTEILSTISGVHIDSMDYFLDREMSYMYSIIPIVTFDSILVNRHNYEILKTQLDSEYSHLLKLNR